MDPKTYFRDGPQTHTFELAGKSDGRDAAYHLKQSYTTAMMDTSPDGRLFRRETKQGDARHRISIQSENVS